MNYITTNIRLYQDDYFRLKDEAAKQRKSLSAVIRNKLAAKPVGRSKTEAIKIMADIRKIAKENAKYTKEFDSVKALREIRYEN